MDELIESLLQLIEEKKHYDEKKRVYGEEWGFYGLYAVESYELAQREFSSNLAKIIDERIKSSKQVQ
jgi:ribonucleotide reductase alpha subunit